MVAELGNYTADHAHLSQPAPANATPGKGEPGTLPGGMTRDYFREHEQVGGKGQDLPQQVTPSVNPARVWQSVRMRQNTIRGLTFERLANYLEQWWYGYFRAAGQTWATMMRRDYQLQICAPKRFKAVARHGYEVQMVSDLEGDELKLAEEQQTFLKEFYDNVEVQTAVNPDERGGFALLVRQMMESVAYYYAIHEIVWEPKEDGTLGAKFIYCPVWWFEGVQGKLRYLDSEFQVWGREMLPAEWLVSCNAGVMEALSILYMLKHGALTSWVSMLEKFGWPGLIGKTHAQKGTTEWNAMAEALKDFGEDFAAVIGGCTGDLAGNDITLVQAAAGQNGQAFAALVEKLDRAITQIFRGGDLGTNSSYDSTGASLQGDESEVLETDDAKFIEETLDKKVSHFALEWRFGEGCPKYAYLKLRTEAQQATTQDLAIDAFLLQNGGALDKQETYERYGRTIPSEGDDVLQAPNPLAAMGGPPGAGGPPAPPAAGEPGEEPENPEEPEAPETPEDALAQLAASAEINNGDVPGHEFHGNQYTDSGLSKKEQLKSDPSVHWHGTPSGDLAGGKHGLHIGTYKAAKQALEARIGIPASGEWDGTRKYGETLLAGKRTLMRLDPQGYNRTGYNADAPEDDYLPRGDAKYSDGTPVSLDAKPNILPVRIKGKMTNSPVSPMTDTQANAIMKAQTTKGKARRGYFYRNEGEDAGSISAVVPNQEHLEVVSIANSKKLNRDLHDAAGATHIRPTPAQAEAGNYRKGKLNFHGLQISLENPKGSVRHGYAADGSTWSAVLPAHYGYLRRQPVGHDGDPVDVYVGPHTDSQKVFVIDQRDPHTKDFDEHKCCLGFNTQGDALHTYAMAFSDGLGKERVGGVREMTLDDFKAWLNNGQPTAQFDNLQDPDSTKLAAAQAVDLGPLAGELARIYALQDPAQMRVALTAYMDRIAQEEKTLGQHSSAEDVLHTTIADSLATRLARTRKQNTKR